jgi:hypothetical protein
MEKQSTLALVALAVVALVLGGLVTYVAFPKIEVQTVTQTVEVPKIVEVAKEVVKEVPVEKIVTVEKNVTVEVPMNLEKGYLQPAVDEFLDEVADEDDYLVCDGQEYDEDQVEVKKLYDAYSVDVKDMADGEYSVSFKAKLKYLDADVEEKCTKTYEVTVEYDGKDNDTDTKVVIA